MKNIFITMCQLTEKIFFNSYKEVFDYFTNLIFHIFIHW